MKIFLIAIFAVVSFACSAQVKWKQFRKADYPETKYATKIDVFAFGDFTVELIQAKLRKPENFEKGSAYCRIWLNVKKGNVAIDSLFYNDCEALGGCSGIYAPKKQPRTDYFVLSKFGDYDGRILIINQKGKIQSFFGGHFYVSPDNRYLFSPYDADLAGLTVYDFLQHKVLFTSDDLDRYFSGFYNVGNHYFAIISQDVKKSDGRTEIITFDLESKSLVPATVNEEYLAKANRLAAYNVHEYAPCDCGRTEKVGK